MGENIKKSMEIEFINQVRNIQKEMRINAYILYCEMIKCIKRGDKQC